MHRLACNMVIASFLSFASLTTATPGLADVVITIDKSSQRMSVTVDGARRYNWAVSTDTRGGLPSGVYRPQRFERSWYSRKFGRAPMPHSIFFHGGYAIHGTTHVSRLGRRASHGCVRQAGDDGFSAIAEPPWRRGRPLGPVIPRAGRASLHDRSDSAA
jgi:L,D-transpeptidase catalytic domain